MQLEVAGALSGRAGSIGSFSLLHRLIGEGISVPFDSALFRFPVVLQKSRQACMLLFLLKEPCNDCSVSIYLALALAFQVVAVCRCI